FDRLPGSDPRLGPEMKSTGEVMGTASEPGLAYWKAQLAADNAPELGGTAVVDLPVDGFEEYFDVAVFDDVSEAITRGDVDFLVSDDVDALRTAVEEEIPYVSTVESAEALVEALAYEGDDLEVAPVGDRPIKNERWG
ncbi:MAG: carbamoyl-phosphate synthase large subunit, partial [Halobacterium sp.]